MPLFAESVRTDTVVLRTDAELLLRAKQTWRTHIDRIPRSNPVVRCMERLMQDGESPGLATHDERIIAHARMYAMAAGIAPERFEFQMLYGIRRDLQELLVREGYRVRVYVPFGTQWYPYLMRRLAERPANLAFITGNMLREMLSGSSRRAA